MHRSSFRTATAVVPFVLIVLAACDAESPTTPLSSPTLSRSAHSVANAPSLIICPTTQSYVARGTIGPRGGSIHVAGHRLTIPRGVLTAPTHFTLTAPSGPEVKLELSANGAEHYRFAAPVVVTISYDRCTRQHWPPTPATAWYVESGRLVERMRGNDDRRRRAVTFRTNHFSTYTVAY